MKLNNLKIGARLGLAFSAVLALAVALTAVGSVALSRTTDAAAEMDIAVGKMRQADRWLAATQINRVLIDARLRAFDADDVKRLSARMKANSAEISAIKDQLDRTIVRKEGRDLIAQTSERRKTYIAIRTAVFALKDSGTSDRAALNRMVDEKMAPALASYEDAVGQLAKRQATVFDQAREHARDVVASGRMLLLCGAAAALALGAALAWRLTRGITRPLRQAVALANAVAAGDLSSQVLVERHDETGELMAALQTMNANLNGLVAGVRRGAESIATGAVEVAAGNHDLSLRTEQQAGALEESAAAMEQLTSTVKQNADNARAGSALATTASDIATRGGDLVGDVIATMGAIDQSSRKIVDIIAVIDSIAFQTNILALNAAVEAARAGEQGRGFAVVASEVRTLAQRSATAAKEIKTLIGDTVAKVGQGTRLVGAAGATMTEVVDSVRGVTGLMHEIAAASSEQSIGVNQIGEAIMQMDQVTQENAALVEQAAAATESMQEQAHSLAQAVSVFKLAPASPAALPPRHGAQPPAAPQRALRPRPAPLRATLA
jgi:methyl-accepting chemotaxis protein